MNLYRKYRIFIENDEDVRYFVSSANFPKINKIFGPPYSPVVNSKSRGVGRGPTFDIFSYRFEGISGYNIPFLVRKIV